MNQRNPDADELTTAEQSKVVLEVVAHDGIASLPKVERHTGFSQARIRTAAMRLERDDLVVTEGIGSFAKATRFATTGRGDERAENMDVPRQDGDGEGEA